MYTLPDANAGVPGSGGPLQDEVRVWGAANHPPGTSTPQQPDPAHSTVTALSGPGVSLIASPAVGLRITWGQVEGGLS